MKVLYITGSCLTKNTSANMSHNGYVQGLLENGAEVTILMANDSWGKTDNKLHKWENAKYIEFNSVSFMDRSKVRLIRPLIYIDEKYIKGVARRYEMPIIHNPCPSNFNSKRQWAKETIETLNKQIPFAEDRIKSAIFHPERNNLWEKPKK